MSLKSLEQCNRTNLCVDCDDTECMYYGQTMADCPKYGCDNYRLYDCKNCDFIKQYQKEMRS